MKTIRSCAVTGSIHLHARDPQTGRPSPDPALFEGPVAAVRESGAVLNISTGGSAQMSVQERLAPAMQTWQHGIGADQDNLAHMVAIADRLFGSDYVFSTFAAGRHQMDFVTASALRGGHVRVGLEDSLMIARGTFATDNAQQVTKAATILRELGRTVATPAQARELLGL